MKWLMRWLMRWYFFELLFISPTISLSISHLFLYRSISGWYCDLSHIRFEWKKERMMFGRWWLMAIDFLNFLWERKMKMKFWWSTYHYHNPTARRGEFETGFERGGQVRWLMVDDCLMLDDGWDDWLTFITN